MVYTTFVPDCGSVRKILVDGNVTLFLVAPSACHRFYTQWACQRNPVATPIAASVQNLYIYLMAHMCQRPRPVNGAIFIYIIQNTAPRGRYPERTACITLAWLRVGGRTPDAAILFSRAIGPDWSQIAPTQLEHAPVEVEVVYHKHACERGAPRLQLVGILER